MKILVYDIAAEDGGGLFVLKNFYQEILLYKPENIEWVFVVSTDAIKSAPHIKVIKNNNIKKSYLQRLKFVCSELHDIIKNECPDLIISLQNMPINIKGIKQFVYMHQSLQFCPKQFSFLKSEERRTAIRQHIICNIYKITLPKASHIFVQTKWIKEATCKWLKCKEDKITIVPVSINVNYKPMTNYNGYDSGIFFYPARAEIYKNHEVIIKACRQLKEQGIDDFKVIFTIDPEECAYAQYLYKEAAGLPIEFIGSVPYDKIWNYYNSTILLFPSYLETCGLPMLEVKKIGGKILASDMPFSHEDLDGYPNVAYFKYNDSAQLAEKMKKCILDKKYVKVVADSGMNQSSLLKSMLNEV